MKYKTSILAGKILSVGALLTLGLSACAVYSDPCTTDAAYNSGYSDAQAGVFRRHNYAAGCPGPRYVLNRAYRRGYNQGRWSRGPRYYGGGYTSINIYTHYRRHYPGHHWNPNRPYHPWHPGNHHPQPGPRPHPHPGPRPHPHHQHLIGPGGTQHLIGPGGTQHLIGPGGTRRPHAQKMSLIQ